MQPCDLDKQRKLALHPAYPERANEAARLLEGLPGIQVKPGRSGCHLTLRYNVCEYTLAGLEKALLSQGFQLAPSLLQKIKRALIHFCESVQRRNVAAHEPDCKTPEIFSKIYERHLHGDQDKTPEAWREYR